MCETINILDRSLDLRLSEIDNVQNVKNKNSRGAFLDKNSNVMERALSLMACFLEVSSFEKSNTLAPSALDEGPTAPKFVPELSPHGTHGTPWVPPGALLYPFG